MTIDKITEPSAEPMEIYMGPMHPMLHGLWAYRIVVDGERVLDSEVKLGYIHRGIEKLAENRNFKQFPPIADRLCYGASTSWNLTYVMAVERAMGIEAEIPERAQWLRVLGLEMTRICSHLMWMAAWLADLGSWTMLMLPFREREFFFDLMESWTGGRLHYNFARVGGLADNRDLPPGFVDQMYKVIDRFMEKFEVYRDILDESEVFMQRTRNLGILKKEDALKFGVTGPNLRASGVNLDWRKKEPYLVYDQLKFNIPVYTKGDAYSRYQVRMDEMRESCEIMKQVVEKMPESGPLNMRPPNKIEGKAFVRTADPRGAASFFIIGDGSNTPYRLKIRSPCFCNMQSFPTLTKYGKVADIVSVIGSMDVCLGETDR
ncbi:MAG: NADH-quinone oxidoreductase subunit D [Candidatus Odinarchaeota archaeon]